MFKIHDPLGLIEQDPELSARVRFHYRIVVPVCLTLIAISLLFIVGVVWYEVIKSW